MFRHMTEIAMTGCLVLAVAAPVAYGQTYEDATNEALSTMSEESQDVMAQMIEDQAAAHMEEQDALMQQLQEQAGLNAISGAGQGQGEQTAVQYKYEPYKGEAALEHVELPERLFNNIPDIRP